MRDCRLFYTKGRDGIQAPSSSSGSSAQKKYLFYALQTRLDHEGSSDVFTGIEILSY